MTAPPLELDETCRCLWDVVVVGAGPAGALAACLLARRGLRVLLVDKASFPRWKVCGSCLNGSALSVLEKAGLGDVVSRLGAIPLRSAWLAAQGRCARLPLPKGAALSRQALDTALIEAAMRAGAAFMPETKATLGRLTSEARGVLLRRRDRQGEANARLVLAAGGLGCNLGNHPRCGTVSRPVAATAWHLGVSAGSTASRSRLGVGAIVEEGPEFYQPGTVYMACGGGGYVGLVRIEDGRLDLAAALTPELLKTTGKPGGAAARLLKEAGLPPVAGLAEAAWRGTPPLTRYAARLAAERLFVLGDAASSAEPFTGEGMAWALASAENLVPLAVRGVQRWEAALARGWTETYRRTIIRRQWSCRALAALLRRPCLTGALVGMLARFPALAAPWLRRVNR